MPDVRLLRVEVDLLVRVFRALSGASGERVACRALPADARVVGWYADPLSREFILHLESSHWPPAFSEAPWRLTFWQAAPAVDAPDKVALVRDEGGVYHLACLRGCDGLVVDGRAAVTARHDAPEAGVETCWPLGALEYVNVPVIDVRRLAEVQAGVAARPQAQDPGRLPGADRPGTKQQGKLPYWLPGPEVCER